MYKLIDKLLDDLLGGWLVLTGSRRRKLFTAILLLVGWIGTLRFCRAQTADATIITTTAFLICAALSFLYLCTLRLCLSRRGLVPALAVLGCFIFTLAVWLFFFTGTQDVSLFCLIASVLLRSSAMHFYHKAS